MSHAGSGAVEYAWFGALCDDDYEYLGVPDPELRSSWEHCQDIVRAADRLGDDNVLLPSGHALGIDSFILSGYPHRDEAEHFARLVLDRDPARIGR